jgi:hypothetical protein
MRKSLPDKVEKAVILRLVRGNVRLQLGYYRTDHEIAKDRERVLSHKF